MWKERGLIWLLALIGAYLIGMVLFLDAKFAFQVFLIWGTTLAIILLLIGPIIWLKHRKRRDESAGRSGRLIGIAALVFLVEMLLLFSGLVLNIWGWEWNWLGKILSLAVAVTFVALWSGLSWRDIGLTAPRPGSWLRVIFILAGTFGFWYLAASSGELMNSNLETILYQATMPGLEEEFIFRGILWSLIAQALPGSRRLWGADVGWSLVITTLIFASVHGVSFNADLIFVFDPALLIFAAVSGFVLGWIRAYSGSILPAIILHNGINLLAVIVPTLA